MPDLQERLKEHLPRLQEVQQAVHDHWGREDLVYRFYHGSYKVYRTQEMTKTIVDTLQAVSPESVLEPLFLQIVKEGTGKAFSLEVNKHWLAQTRPIIEAFLHATYFLDMAVTYAQAPEEGELVHSGYAALRALYGMR